MEKGRTFESVVGVFVLIVASFFFYYVYMKSGWQSVDGYLLTAKFDKADGLAEGSDVKVSGIKVGKIVNVSIDPTSFLAVVKFTVLEGLRLPNDTSANVSSDGLLGKRYLSLTPGGNDASLKGGDEIENTSGPVDIESLIGKFVFSQNKGT
ncbi:MAG: outer membrane lipid asymmetry maintenance protein MlaD [Holosporaceae bacterium]|jgi:phospholipid/cholesterol/gamma-HCH transport system substrate-binding protein|nr:outer membrane lipid asymmetry maintenance protein MlaD [Holosporaceae bacterium]